MSNYDYQCFDSPPNADGWEPVGKCHPDEESCAKECPPIVYGGVCAYREEEEYCGPSDELPGVRGDWCRVVDIPDDKSCADKGAAFCCDAYSNDIKTLRDQFSGYTVGSEVTGFSLSWDSIAGPFVVTYISGSRYIAEAPTDDGVAWLEVELVSPTNIIYGCRGEVKATFNLPISNSFGENYYGLRFSYDSRQGMLTAFPFDTSLLNTKIDFGGKEFNFNGDPVSLKSYDKATWKQNWTTFVAASTKDFKDNRNQFATISAVEWNANQSLQGQVNIAGYDSSGMPRDEELVNISFTWPDLFTRKISPPNPYWYCSSTSYLVANYCPTDDLDPNVTYYRKEEEALYACTAVACAYSDYSWDCFHPADVPDEYDVTDPNGIFCIKEGSRCDRCCEDTNSGHVGYKVVQKFAENPIQIGDAAPFTYTGEGPFAVQGDLVCVGVVGDAYIFEDSDPQKPFWCTALNARDPLGNTYCYQSCGPGPVNATSERFESCEDCNAADCTDRCFDPDIGPQEECDPNAEYEPILQFTLTIIPKERNLCYSASLSMTYNNHEGTKGNVNFNGKSVYAQSEAGTGGVITGSFGGNNVPFGEVNCTGLNNDTPQDDMKGPLEWQHFQPADPNLGTSDQSYSFSLQYDDVLQSPCWLCPDQPKPTRDPGNPAYPGTVTTTGGQTMPTTKTTGPGTHLAKTLALWGFKEGKGCSCKKMSRLMDGWGSACAKDPHLTTIVDHLEKEAKKRKLPFVRKLAEALIKRAVRQSEKQS